MKKVNYFLWILLQKSSQNFIKHYEPLSCIYNNESFSNMRLPQQPIDVVALYSCLDQKKRHLFAPPITYWLADSETPAQYARMTRLSPTFIICESLAMQDYVEAFANRITIFGWQKLHWLLGNPLSKALNHCLQWFWCMWLHAPTLISSHVDCLISYNHGCKCCTGT